VLVFGPQRRGRRRATRWDSGPGSAWTAPSEAEGDM